MARTIQRSPQRSAERLMRLLPVLLLLLLARPDLAASATSSCPPIRMTWKPGSVTG